jgi:hypothetical protein
MYLVLVLWILVLRSMLRRHVPAQQMADEAGVHEVDVFSDVEPPSDPYNSSRWPVRSSMPWWSALGKWKQRHARAMIVKPPAEPSAPLRSGELGSPPLSPPLPSGVRFIAAATGAHCVPGQVCAMLYYRHSC